MEYLCCYKSELGLCLQRMIEAYNLIFVMQFEGYYKNENSKVKEFQHKISSLDTKANQIQDEQA